MGFLESGESKQRRRSVGFTYEGLQETACMDASLFVEPPSTELICDIGKGVMRDPVACASRCHHQYCRQCIVTLTRTSAKCPVSQCPSTIDHSQLLPLAEKADEIAVLRVVCANGAKGCTWSGPVQEVAEHMKVCKRYLPITCEMCKQKVKREDMAVHATQLCPKLPTVCPHCDETVVASDLQRHVENDCFHGMGAAEILDGDCSTAGAALAPRPSLEGPSDCDDSSPDEQPTGFAAIHPPSAACVDEDAASDCDVPGPPPPAADAKLKQPSPDSTPSPSPSDGCRRRKVLRSALAWGSADGGLGKDGAPPADLWERLDDVKRCLGADESAPEAGGERCNSGEVPPDMLQLLLCAVSSLQSRVSTLELENESLRLLARRSPSPLPHLHPRGSPPPLGPLKLNPSGRSERVTSS